MRFFLGFILSLCLLSVPAFAGGNGVEAAKAEAKPSSTHIAPHGLKAKKIDIPKEYEDLVKAYQKYWGFFIKKDFAEAYKMESADYRKANPYDAEKYKSALAGNVKLSAVKALEVKKISEKEVMVQGNYYYGIEGLKGLKPFTDRWVKEDGAWMHVPTKGQFRK